MKHFTDHRQRYIDSFKEMYPYDFQVHLTVTPPTYAVDGNIKKVRNYDDSGFTPYFPDSNQKMNLWLIDSILKPLNTCTEGSWDGDSQLYAVIVTVPMQPGKPQHIHCALGSFGVPITASGINDILAYMRFSKTTALATEFYDNTENYIYRHLLQRNVVCTPHCWKIKPKKQTPIPNI